MSTLIRSFMYNTRPFVPGGVLGGCLPCLNASEKFTDENMGSCMIRLVAMLVLSLGLVNVAAAGDPAAGQGKAAVCAGCHGADGNSAVPTFPKLAAQGDRYLAKQIHDIKSGSRVVVEMTGLTDNLSEQDIGDLAAYYASQSSSTGAVDPALLESGEALFKAGNSAKGIPSCIGCHGPAGKGVAAAGFPRLAGQHGDYIAGQLTKFRSGDRMNDDSAMMRSIAANLSDAEIKAVSSYISGLY
jgi:cbb3-type cytochrome c oxidase subunit III